jgi:hypothetical protein
VLAQASGVRLEFPDLMYCWISAALLLASRSG